jgi:hypothetical protein
MRFASRRREAVCHEVSAIRAERGSSATVRLTRRNPMKYAEFVFAGLASVVLAGAAAATERKDQEPAVPDPRLGEEVSQICFARNINGWKEIKGDEEAVLLETGVNNWYRVEVAGTCRYRDFRFAQAIGIESRPGGGCVTRGDVILVEGGGNFVHRCFITKINKWDEKAKAPEEAKPE